MKTPTMGSSNGCGNSQSGTPINFPTRANEEVREPTLSHENAILKQNNEELRLENMAIIEALKNPHRSIQEHKLLIENARLKEELRSKTSLVKQQIATQTKRYLMLAPSALDELLKLGTINAPLWNKNTQGEGETLDFETYERIFPPLLGPKPLGFVSEATRASGVIPMATSTFVEALLDVQQWREIFTGMIGRCTTKVVTNGIGGSGNGALQLVNAEIHLISSSVAVRLLKFIRFAKQQAEGLWVVVDYHIDYGTEGQLTRRCPSGCILHAMPNGFTKVTWIEHTEYDEQLIPHNYRGLIRSGMGFGAQRWISALLGQCKCILAVTTPSLNHHLFASTRKSLNGLARRMRRMFCGAVCLTGVEQWVSVADAPGSPRIMACKYTDFHGRVGVIMSATYSVLVESQHQHLFNMLMINEFRGGWDMICHAIATREMMRFQLSQDVDNFNYISILNSDTPAGENGPIRVLQEALSDTTGSLIVYATVDSPTVDLVMNGGNPSHVALLPIGLSIVPYYGERGEQGSMVTLGLHVLLPNQAIANITMDNITGLNYLVARTVMGIKRFR